MSLPRRRVLRTRGRVERFPHLVTPSPRYRYRVSDLPEPPPTDQQREAAVARLTEHIGAGHLTLAEFDERARASYRAGSAAELARVTADLPAPDAPQPARPTPRRWLVSLFGGADITGRCRLGPRLNSITVMGGNDLDLRHAVLDGGELTITAIAVMGGQDIYLPEGVEVQVDGFALFGRQRPARWRRTASAGRSGDPDPGSVDHGRDRHLAGSDRRVQGLPAGRPPPGARDRRRAPLASLVTDRAISQHHRGDDRQDAHRLQRAGRLAEHEQPHH
jgi:hypothetical protein